MSTVKPFSWIVRFDVAPLWVADGFIMTDAIALDMISGVVDCANQFELSASVISAPAAERIAEEQGYLPSNHPEQLCVVINDSPRAYAEASVVNSLNDAIAALENTQNNKNVLKNLRSSLALLTGDKPISDIVWHPTPE